MLSNWLGSWIIARLKRIKKRSIAKMNEPQNINFSYRVMIWGESWINYCELKPLKCKLAELNVLINLINLFK